MRGMVLVGLMGAGKSLVGGLVAEETGWELVDVDVAIAARTGATVREIWQSGGEAAYRQLESEEVLHALQRVSPVVIAAPGGVILDPAVRAELDDAFVVWLAPIRRRWRVACGPATTARSSGSTHSTRSPPWPASAPAFTRALRTQSSIPTTSTQNPSPTW